MFAANHLTDTDKQNSKENTDKQTQYKSEKVDNLKYGKTKLTWFSCLLQHSARKRGGLILHRPRAHTGLSVYKWQIYQIAEWNRKKIDSVARIKLNQNFLLPELECSNGDVCYG